MQAKARASADDQRDARRDSSAQPRLDERYGKIGIPAVAAAVRCRSRERKVERVRYVPRESD